MRLRFNIGIVKKLFQKFLRRSYFPNNPHHHLFPHRIKPFTKMSKLRILTLFLLAVAFTAFTQITYADNDAAQTEQNTPKKAKKAKGF